MVSPPNPLLIQWRSVIATAPSRILTLVQDPLRANHGLRTGYWYLRNGRQSQIRYTCLGRSREIRENGSHSLGRTCQTVTKYPSRISKMNIKTE